MDPSFAEAYVAVTKALELNPLLPSAHTAQVVAHDLANAIEAMRSAVDVDPALTQAWGFGGEALELAGRFDEAIDARVHQGKSEELIAALRTGLAAAGARGYWSALRDYHEQHARPTGALVMAYARLGQQEAALDKFERAVSERWGWVVYANVLPMFDGLRAHPRFKALTARIGLPDPPADDVRPDN